MIVVYYFFIRRTRWMIKITQKTLKTKSREKYIEDARQEFKNDPNTLELIKACADKKLLKAMMIRTRIAVSLDAKKYPFDPIYQHLNALSDEKRLFVMMRNTMLFWPQLLARQWQKKHNIE